jgi:fused signal recognition particle receptor
MFSFFRKKTEPAVTPAAAPADVSDAAPASAPAAPVVEAPAPPPPPPPAALDFLKRVFTGPTPVAPPPIPVPVPVPEPPPVAPAAEAAPPVAAAPPQPPVVTSTPRPTSPVEPPPPMPRAPVAAPEPAPREAWFQRLRRGLARTGTGIAQVFTGVKIDDELYEELESALLMADAGVRATEHLLKDLKQRVKDQKATDPAQVKTLLADAIVALLEPLERSLMVGEHTPTVIMVAGVNGAGKTTSIGKLTRHLAEARCKVLLAAADTFRAAAREQLAVWADRNQVEIVSQEGGDPASVTFDAVNAGRARGCDVVIADTAGRLPTQLHLMEELKKIRRVINKADNTAPHEVLLVVDGNTGQNALEQVKAFDAALGLTGLVVTKLDGTAKGGVLAAIALWARDRAQQAGGAPVIPVYFIGVGEKLEDLQTFNAREFAQALLG